MDEDGAGGAAAAGGGGSSAFAKAVEEDKAMHGAGEVDGKRTAELVEAPAKRAKPAQAAAIARTNASLVD
eukprot:7877899-Lingulodinium_polyedra.AAC.1